MWNEMQKRKKNIKKKKIGYEISLALSFMFVYSAQPKINSLMTRVTSNLIDSNVRRVYFVWILLHYVMRCLIQIDRIMPMERHINLNISVCHVA